MRHKSFLLGVAIAASGLLLGGCGNTASSPVTKEDPKTQRQEAARVHTELGQKYLQQGKSEIALEKLNKALEFDPDYVDAHTVIAVLYESINDQAKAEEHYRRAVQLKPKGGAEKPACVGVALWHMTQCFWTIAWAVATALTAACCLLSPTWLVD